MASEMEGLKKGYDKLKKKYKLPDFKSMNEEFDIEKIPFDKTDLLLREIRRKIEGRCGNFLKMLEEFVNPQFASLASLTIIKSFSSKDKESVMKNYHEIVSLMLKSGALEASYDEKGDAEYINQSYKDWQIIKKDLKELLENADKAWAKKVEKEKKPDKRSYFG